MFLTMGVLSLTDPISESRGACRQIPANRATAMGVTGLLGVSTAFLWHKSCTFRASEPEIEEVPQARPARGARQNGRAGGVPQVALAQGQRPVPQGAGNPQAAAGHGRTVQVPLQPILDGLPLELQPRVVDRNVGDLN